jgi:hypothetical protein
LRPAVRPRAREKSLTTMPNKNHLQSRDAEAASPASNFKTQRQHILDLLMAAEGAEVPLAEIMVCAAQYNACIHELRKRGYKIVNRSETCNGVKHSWYRLESSPANLTPRTPDPARSRKKSARPAVSQHRNATFSLNLHCPRKHSRFFPKCRRLHRNVRYGATPNLMV